jgi:hypothetical protein
MFLTNFVRKYFHVFFEICLWLVLIAFTVIGFSMGNVFLYRYLHITVGPLLGGIIGFIVGLIVEVIFGGFIGIVLNYYNNIENISKNMIYINENLNILVSSNDNVKDIKKSKYLAKYNKATHRVLQRVNLRSEPNMGSNDYLEEDTLVMFIKEGEGITVNGITLPSYFVETETGKQGWVFSGHLSKL